MPLELFKRITGSKKKEESDSKKVLSSILVDLVNKSEGEIVEESFKIDIEYDETYKIDRFYSRLDIYDKDGDISRSYDWKAGSTIKLEFVYENIQWYDGK